MSKKLFTVWVWQLGRTQWRHKFSFVSLLDAYLMHPNENDVPVSFLGDQSGKTSMVGSSLNISHGISIPGYVWGWRWGDGWG